MADGDKIFLKGGRVFNPTATVADDLSQEADIRIQGGIVTEIKANLKPRSDDLVIDANGLWIMPGLIDMHTHLRDLGQAHKETIESGTRCAAAGGYTTVVAMANTDPPTDNALILSRINELVAQRSCIQVLPVACVTKGMKGQELTDMAELSEMGAIAFSDDGMPLTDLAVLRRALEYVELTGRFIISHPEDKDLSGAGAMNECCHSIKLGLPGIPSVSESACIAREIEVVRYTGARLHFAHVSAAASVELIRRAKADGLRITADVTPHHLLLADEDIITFDSRYKMNPPLRNTKDQEALVAALRDGTIDVVATDHAPHSASEKARTFVEAPFGIIGLETAFPLVLERLTTDDPLCHLEVINMFTGNPARILGLPKPRIAVGSPANISMFDPQTRWTYDTSNGLSKSTNSPFHGRRIRGKNVVTIYKGRVVYHDETHATGRFNLESSGVS